MAAAFVLSVVTEYYWVGMLKNGWDLLGQETLESSVSNKWFDELSRLIEWLLHVSSDWIICGLTTNLICVLGICWVSTAAVLVKNDVLFLVRAGKVLEFGFPKCF